MHFIRFQTIINLLADKKAQIEIQDNGDIITLKQSYINLIDQLEIDGIPKEKNSSMGGLSARLPVKAPT